MVVGSLLLTLPVGGFELTQTTEGSQQRAIRRLIPTSMPLSGWGGGGQLEGGLGWVGLGQGLIRTSGTTDVALPCASQLVRLVHGYPVSRPTGLMTAPVPRWHRREEDAAVPVCMWRARCLCVWGMRWRGSEARRVTR